EASVRVSGKTGVEMEAMSAVSVAGLTIYDMCKAVDREMSIGEIRLVKKSGGKNGTCLRKEKEVPPTKHLLSDKLKKDNRVPVLRGHPWIFSGAIERIENNAAAVGVADVFDWEKHWIARGLFSPKSQIRVRVLTWRQEVIDRDFFHRRLSQALSFREKLVSKVTNAYRIVNGEGDSLPGLIVDRYSEFLVCQFFTAGMDGFKPAIVESLSKLVTPTGIFEKSEGRVRDEEGIAPSVGVLAGEPPPELLAIEENGFKFVIYVRRGRKSRFFLDQRDNRALLSTIARDKKILNCFSYSGAFSVCALGGGAKEVVSLDSSKSALELARRNLALNGFETGGSELLKGDVFTYL